MWLQRAFVWLVDVCFLLCLILFSDFYFERRLFDKQNGLLENGLLKYFKGVNMIIGSMMAASTKTLQFISVAVLKIIFKRHSGKAGLWTHGLDFSTLDTWALGLWMLGHCKPERLDSGRMNSGGLDAWTLDAWTLEDWALALWRLGIWTLGLRTTGCLDSGRLESGRLKVRALDAWALYTCTFGLWTPRR